jgi:hypothetical protein
VRWTTVPARVVREMGSVLHGRESVVFGRRDSPHVSGTWEGGRRLNWSPPLLPCPSSSEIPVAGSFEVWGVCSLGRGRRRITDAVAPPRSTGPESCTPVSGHESAPGTAKTLRLVPGIGRPTVLRPRAAPSRFGPGGRFVSQQHVSGEPFGAACRCVKAAGLGETERNYPPGGGWAFRFYRARVSFGCSPKRAR